MPQVSVVVPVYNAEKYIAETLTSIMGQSFVDFDVHVVDDCSTDDSAKIVQEFCARDARFHYHRSPSNFGGPAGPRNLGIDQSSGGYIAFCDADDLWAPYKLELQMAIARDSGADIVSAVVRDFADGENPAAFVRPDGEVPLTSISHGRLLLKNWIALSSVIGRRASLMTAGPFNSSRTHIAVEDFDMWLRITGSGGRVIRIGTPLVHYRKLPSSISASKSMMVRKALNVIGEDYDRRGKGSLFRLLRPAHWILYVGTSAWMRAIRREL
ncbi:MAG TPA: glycosyltransferase family 2 protein [Sphingopyxis sp.]|uniref:glycosyltransferase family 2 protein n=1 Tax=Sphingopyxis sp. TaxID=1908224 RepID=UPI002C615F84|nr:glycosyltransferase family 2 protein [Sphingopyxis sp.]HWW55884.1 glycosyltransferase family 2 protein [Sphingopyxis sp.]